MRSVLALMVAAGLCAPALGQIYVNGGINALPGGCAGGMYSAIEPPDNTFGFNTINTSFNIADDFTVPAGETWKLEKMEWMLYQTSTTPTEPITAAFVSVWTTMPTTGGSATYGNQTTNRLISSTFSGVYRTSTVVTDCARAIKTVSVDMSWLPPLGEGTYWVQFGSTGNPAFTGPWANLRVPRDGTENARILYVVDCPACTPPGLAGEWRELVSGAGFRADMPFKLFGQVNTGGCGCVCNYDQTTGPNVCDIFDFLEFGNLFNSGDPCACELDQTTGPNVCDIFDFLEFGNLFNTGC